MKHLQPKQLHEHQLSILKKLVVSKHLRFNQMLSKDIDSEHMNYHLQKLIEYGFVHKVDNHYALTNEGKDYTNLMDDTIDKLEKQPKTGVIIGSTRFNEEKQAYEYLLTKRLRHPYFGKVGRIGGKVQFGETLEQAARRELKEESGLDAKEMTLERIYHKLRHEEDGTCVQDVIFYIFFAHDVSGELITKNNYQENFWATKDDVFMNMDAFDDLILEPVTKPKALTFEENIDIAQGY